MLYNLAPFVPSGAGRLGCPDKAALQQVWRTFMPQGRKSVLGSAQCAKSQPRGHLLVSTVKPPAPQLLEEPGVDLMEQV